MAPTDTAKTTRATSPPASNTATTSNTNDIFLALAGSKHKRKLGATLNESAASGPNDFAKRQLEKLGWKEGGGLGKKRDGRSTHIRVQQRAHQSGLGSSATSIDPVVSADQWWKSSVGDTLARLSSSLSSSSKKKKKKKDKKKRNNGDNNDDDKAFSAIETKRKTIYTDEELFQATGGVRFGMRAQTQQHSKWKRAESNISHEEEREAKQKTEWDGLSAPRVILKGDAENFSDKKKPKKKRSREELMSGELESSSSVTGSNKDEELDAPRQKKKKERKSTSDDMVNSSKKEKKSKKKMKKSKQKVD